MRCLARPEREKLTSKFNEGLIVKPQPVLFQIDWACSKRNYVTWPRATRGRYTVGGKTDNRRSATQLGRGIDVRML